MMIEEQAVHDAPAPEEVRRALEQMLASETFRGSPQLAAFLRFVVEATLRGESHRIKGYTIGVEAFGRDERFDPQIDPIVRVEATRLRRTLERYYAGPGADDPIVIELSRGSYIPTMRRQRRPDAEVAAASSGLDWRSRLARFRDWRASLAATAVFVVVAAVVVVLTTSSRDAEKHDRSSVVPARDSGDQSFSGPLRPGNGAPTLFIAGVTVTRPAPAAGQPRAPTSISRPITEKLRAAFARFDTLNVLSDAISEPAGQLPAAKAEATTDYRLTGTVDFQEDGSASARFNLLDTSDATIVWSQTFGPFTATTDYGPVEDSVVRQIAMTLLPPYGVIRTNERKKHLATGAGDPRYRCIVESSESFRSFDPAQHIRARVCLELLTVRDPNFAAGFAYLAAVYTREYQYGLGAAPDDISLLDRALQAARRGIELGPESARAYQMLFTVLFARQEVAAAFAAGDKAIALNPYDMTILSDYGGRLILAGEVDRGMELLTRAAEASAVRPSWYHFYLFLGSYLKNDMADASRNASMIATEIYPFGLLAHALVSASDGNREIARRDYDQLVLQRPGWRDSPRGELSRLFPTPSVVDRLVRDLVNAGLVQGR